MSIIVDTLRATLLAVPDSWQTRLALIEALLAEDEYDEAAAVLENVIELPEDLDSQILVARAYGLFEAQNGLEIIDHVLDSHPECGRAHFEKAFLCHRAGDSATGVAHYFAATSLDPSLADPALQLSLTGKEAHGPDENEEGVAHQTPVDSEGEDKSPVYYPAPGEYPVRTLREALGMPPEPLIDPDTVPAFPQLEYVQDPGYQETEYTPQETFISQVQDVELHLGAAEEKQVVVYDYDHPDDSIFDPVLTPDEIYVAALTTEEGQAVANLQETIRRNKEHIQKTTVAAEKRERFAAMLTGLIVTAGCILLAALVVVAVPRPPPPAIVATSIPSIDHTLESHEMERPQTHPQFNQTSASLSSMSFETAASASAISLTSLDTTGFDVGGADLGMDFGQSLDFGVPGGSASGMFFGSKTKGNLAVVFDITASMYNANPKVVAEVNRVFKEAQVVAVFGATFKRTESVDRLIPYKENEPVLRGVQKNGAGALAKTRDAMNQALFSLRKCDSLKPPDNKLRLQSLGRAIELLLKQPAIRRPGTIFTFSDFRDGCDPDYLEEMCKLAKSRNVKLVFYHPVAFNKDKDKYLAALEETGVKGEVKEGL